MDVREAARNAYAAETTWMARLREAFPNRHLGDVRYTKDAEGRAGSDLRDAWLKYRQAAEDLHKAFDATRTYPNGFPN